MPDNPPINPNPFQQGQSSQLPIDTSQAQKALEDLQRSLEGMMKTFGGTWNKTVGDRLAAEERFYRAVGDKAKARQAELTRHKDELIAKIGEEAKAQIRAYEEEIKAGKRSQDDLLKYKKDISDKSIRIEQEAQAKIKEGRGFKGMVERATTFAGGIGGPIGSTVAGLGNLAANPWTYVIGGLIEGILKTALTQAAFTRTGAGLAGAGFRLGAGAGVGTGFTTSLFGGPLGAFGQALSQDQQRQIVGAMSGSRTLTGQVGLAGGTEAFARNLGLYANILPDAEEETKLFTDATKSLAMTQEDISKTFISSRVNAERLKITQLDAIRTQMEMQKALRNITNDGAVASSVLSNISGYLNSIGASEVEKARIGVAVAQAGANLSLPQIAGMFAFTHGGRLPTPENMFGAGGVVGGGTFKLLGEFLTKVGGQFRDPTQRMFAAGQLQQQFLPGLRLQDLPKFFELSNAMMKGGMTAGGFEKQFRELEGKTPQVAAAEGIATLTKIVDPIQRVENVLSNFWTKLDELFLKYFDHKTGPSIHPVSQSLPTQNIKTKMIGGKHSSDFDVYTSK